MIARWTAINDHEHLRTALATAMHQHVVAFTGAGLSLIDLALAFTLTHPAVTSPIIGPRTMEQLTDLLGAPHSAGRDVLCHPTQTTHRVARR